MRLLFYLLPLSLLGCVDGLTQVAGTGAIYSTKCSAEMEVRNENQYFAACMPEMCSGQFQSKAVNHVVVGVDPGRRLVGYAERICVQDLAHSSGLFNPGLFPPEEKPENNPLNGDTPTPVEEL